MRTLLFLLIIILLSACSFNPPSVVGPSETIVIKPSATPTLVPSPTSTPVSPTSSPQPTADTYFFRDDFVEALDTQWSWIREDPLNWRLVDPPGSLQINVDNGYVAAHNNSNLLLRPAPEGNFQIETQIALRPQHNYQFAGLIIYESDSNFIQAGRQYCSSEGCIGEGLYMDYYRKGIVVKPDFGQRYRSSAPVLLRLSHRGDTYTFDASTDGSLWFLIGSHTSDLNPTQIGLVTGQRLKGDVEPAVFEYFEVRSLP